VGEEEVMTHLKNSDLKPADITDAFNSQTLADLYGERIRYIDKIHDWYLYQPSEHRWREDPKAIRVQELAKSVYKKYQRELLTDINDKDFKNWANSIKYCASGRGIAGMVKLARGIPGILLDHEELDKDPYLLGAKNGVIDLRTGELRDGKPEDLITRQCKTFFCARMPHCPTWEQCLEQWLPDEEVRDYFQKLCGHALIGAQQHHIFVIHYGEGRNGKGTAMRALQQVLGSYSAVPHMSLIVANQTKEHDTEKAKLFRVRLAIASETDRKVSLKESDIKNLTGGDRISARGMRQDPWEFNPSHSLWLCTNHLPEISGRDDAIWSRIKVVPWLESFLGKEDPDLDEKLRKEAPGILAWLVQGCLAYQEHGLEEPAMVKKHTLRYQTSEDRIKAFLDEEGFRFNPEKETSAPNLMDTFSTWCDQEGLNHREHLADLNTYLKEKGCRKRNLRRNGERTRFWKGIHFVEQLEQV